MTLHHPLPGPGLPSSEKLHREALEGSIKELHSRKMSLTGTGEPPLGLGAGCTADL